MIPYCTIVLHQYLEVQEVMDELFLRTRARVSPDSVCNMCWHFFSYGAASWFALYLLQALLEVVDSGAKNMEVAIVRFEKPIEVGAYDCLCRTTSRGPPYCTIATISCHARSG